MAAIAVAALIALLCLRVGSTRELLTTPARPPATPPAVRDEASIAETGSREPRAPVEPAAPAGFDPSPPPAPTGKWTGSFTAKLLEDDGSPIPFGDWVAVVDATGRRRTTDRNSDVFVFPELPFGIYSAIGYAHLHRMLTEPFELTPEHPDLVRELRLTRLAAVFVSVVTPDGRPFLAARREAGAPDFLHEILPIATRESPGRTFDPDRRGGNDPIAVGELWYGSDSERREHPTRMGKLALHADFPVFVNLVLGHFVIETKRVDRGTEEVTFVLSLEQAAALLPSLRVQVLDEVTSRPVDTARVTLHCGRRESVDGHTSASGEATLAPVLPGRFMLDCNKEGYATSRQDVELAPGAAADITLRVSRPLTVEARVISPDGYPMPATLGVMWLRIPTGRDRIQRVNLVSSDAEGRLLIPNLVRGVYLLADPNANQRDPSTTRDDRFDCVPANVILDTTSGSVGPIDVQLRKGVTLRIRPPPGDPADLEFEITDSRELPVFRARFDLPYPRRFCLAPGTYRIRFRDSTGRVLQEKEATLVSSPVEVAFDR